MRSDGSNVEEGVMPDKALDLRVWIRLLGCAKMIEKQLRRNFQEQFDTTLPRFDVMAALDRAADGLRMGALSKALLVSNGNVTSIVRQMEEDGHVAYQPDPRDGRSAIVVLTPLGQTRFQELAQAHHNWVRDALKDLPEMDQAQLLTLLDTLKLSLTRN
ncbi:MarR family winged helix-turn-helix transcriptional regulator [Altericroceibacterium endophyticum]|uniref:MarR family transcriptional regulator n=1 Tax=Altericroceibacterium endophyticum TaxID=1808508 RepID=A0A6I4T7V7_9SPHN|nr:MarR family transcriptional regulator [Altericroceibacterium endophyticum]MXO67046.1 MarR family transcriptional regulator [Altericroceibacterium endophyticum]